MQEYLCTQCLAGTNIDVVILRLQNVYGPGQSLRNPYTGVVSIFCQKVQQGEWLEVFEDGEIIRDFVYIDDVVEAFRNCASLTSPPALPINIGTGSPVSIRSMAKSVLTLYGRSPDEHHITGNFRAGDVRYACSGDSSRARSSGLAAARRFCPGAEALRRLGEGKPSSLSLRGRWR